MNRKLQFSVSEKWKRLGIIASSETLFGRLENPRKVVSCVIMASADAAVPVLIEIAKSVICELKHQARYLFCYNKILEDLRNEKGKLMLTKEGVVEQAKRAHNKTEKIGKEVEKWFEDVKISITDVDKLEEETITNKTTCLFRWCPNCTLQYRLGKKATKKMRKLIELNAKSDFNCFSQLLMLPGMEYHSSGDFIYFESTNLAREQLLEALTDDKNYRIGLYGMGGFGKTTLVKEVGKEVEQSKLFDKVVFIVVSSPPDVRQIQDNIASSLGLKFEEEHESDRAKRLWLRLTNGERILVILDDVWEKLDFKDIGIPTEDNFSGCKVLLTTRSVQVCASTKCQRMILLSLLSDVDAWILFQKHAGITNDSSNSLKDVAKEIAKQCKRLPVAIVTVASSLKDRSLEDWKMALTTLKNSKPVDDIDEDLIRIYECLKLSFDYLRSDKVKNLFLLCALFEKDYEIPMEDLTILGKGLGLLGDVDSYETTRSLVRAAKNKLIDSCLLLQGREGGYVKMHDLVHDMVHWLANNEIEVIMGPKRNTKALAEKFGKASTIRNAGSESFGSKGSAPLEIINPTIAKVNSIVNKSSSTAPKKLEIRRHLYFGELKRLESFELINCWIDELPNGIAEMEELKLLNLRNCKIKRNPYEVIGRCSLLEELYFILNKGLEDPLDFQNAAKLFKRNSSPVLRRYHLEIGGGFDLYSVYDSISRGIAIENFDASSSNTTIKDLVQRAEILHLEKLQGGCRTVIPDIVQAEGGYMNDLILLLLNSCSTIERLVDTSNTNFFLGVETILPNLAKLMLNNMDNLKELCQGPSPFGFLEKLEELYIRNCKQLQRKLFSGSMNFSKLAVVKVQYCPMLTSLFSPSTARTLIMLKYLEIHECNELKCIIADQIEEGEEIVQDNHDQRTLVPMFPNLETLHIDGCNSIEFIFPLSFAPNLPLLKTIKLSRSCELKYIFGIYQHEDPLLLRDEKDNMLPLLNKITLIELPSFVGIYPGSCDELSLQKLLPKNGPILSATTSKPDPHNSVGLYRSNLESLFPVDVSQYLSKQMLHFCYVEKIKLTNCPKLISLFTLSSVPTMLLKELIIKECHGLKHLIIDDGDEHDQLNNGSVFPKLTTLTVWKCRLLESVFPATFSEGLKQLKYMEIAEAPELKYVFTHYHQKDHSSHQKQNKIYINLPALEHLCLRNLPNILSFCSSNYYPTWPFLQKFIVDECPKLSFMSISEVDRKTTEESTMMTTHGRQSRDEDRTLEEMQTLKTIYVNKSKIEGIFQIKRLSINRLQVISSLQSMTLHHLPELRYICISQKQLMSLQSLVFLDVSHCRRLKVIFTVSVLKDLPQLKYLSIRNCEQLEHIIEDDDDQTSSNHHSPQVLLPNLTTIDVQRCRNLQCLFSISTFLDLPRLEYLSIVDSPRLHEVFGCKRSETLDGKDGFMLPSLNFLRLVQLPSLINICHCFQFQTKRDCQVFVRGCPKFPLSSTSNPGDAESKQSQLLHSTEVPTLLSAFPPSSQSLSSISEAFGGAEQPISVCTTRDDHPTTKQASIMSSTEELVDFHNLFKIDPRRASLLDEAFAKYPHLWEWQKGLRLKFCKWGYESLADMLMFLKSETPMAMDDLRKQEFERLYSELDSFGFDKGWLESLYKRVMEVQVDEEKLRELAELELQEDFLLGELNNARIKIGRIRDDVSKYDTIFDF
ncbi:putative P-loop containing nucleoside triphosphate hydrolase, leucine-rich repeat domain, L [Senna tora]|uniref:Putative P-loop containing nucleoside triphosphate hydrolase, leucine-rich repeat domain, L n=1 Tax=Senna tora TaxID=362788 RepID=A0A834WWU6_9FABA|nr:putative P-loop containing nucleoside triphosphate hydrolase, leucine-rich repeat domain, L [Senna tora]